MEKVVVIGLGNIARRHIINIRLLYPDIEIAVFSSSNRKIDLRDYDVDKQIFNLFDVHSYDPSFIVIASPSSFHLSHFRPFSNLDIPILIEKPLSSSSHDAHKFLELIDTNIPTVSVGYCLRYLPSFNIIKKCIKDEIIGYIYNVHAEVGQYLPDWRPNKNYLETVSANKTLGGGVLLELSHELDYLHYFFGNLNLEYANLRNTKSLNLEVEDIADIVLSSSNGVILNVHLDMYQKKAYRKCSFLGDRGRIEWDLILNSVILHDYNGETVLYSDPSFDKNKMYIEMLKDVIYSHDNNLPPPISAKESIFIIDLISDIKKSCSHV